MLCERLQKAPIESLYYQEFSSAGQHWSGVTSDSMRKNVPPNWVNFLMLIEELLHLEGFFTFIANSLFPMWIISCLMRPIFWKQDFPHSQHTKGVFPMWNLQCIMRDISGWSLFHIRFIYIYIVSHLYEFVDGPWDCPYRWSFSHSHCIHSVFPVSIL